MRKEQANSVSCLHVNRSLSASFHSATADSEMERSGIELALRTLTKMIRARGRVLQRSSGLRRNSSLLQHTPSCAYTFASLSLYFQTEEIGFTLLHIFNRK